MLIAKPTKFGSGLTLYGDYFDLRNLHDTITDICLPVLGNENHKKYALGLANDLRKAYEGKRQKEEFGIDELSHVSYYGVDVLWPVFLTQLALLRKFFGFVPTTKEHQSNLYRLEACAEKALMEIEPKAGKESLAIHDLLSSLWDSFLIEYVDYCTRRFLTETRPGKSRLKNLPKYLTLINPFSDEYKAYENEVKQIARDKQCSPEEVRDWGEWPEFKW